VGLLHTLSGFRVGAFVGMTSVGGGSLMTPHLILNFGIHPAAAHCGLVPRRGFLRLDGLPLAKNRLSYARGREH
jgi:hypothetical protein